MFTELKDQLKNGEITDGEFIAQTIGTFLGRLIRALIFGGILWAISIVFCLDFTFKYCACIGIIIVVVENIISEIAYAINKRKEEESC